MNFDYTLKFDMPLDQAWATLMDIEQIAPCMPGAIIESHEGDKYSGRLKVKLGPMELTYRGDIHFIERDDTAHLAVVDAAAKEIKGRGAAKTQVTMRGSGTGDRSEIALSSDFTVSGKAAQFGRGVMEEVGEKLMADFAHRLATHVAATTPRQNADPTLANASETDMDSEAPTVLNPKMHADVSQAAANAIPNTQAIIDSEDQTVLNPNQPLPPSRTDGENEALDLGAAAWWPLLRRFALPAAIVLIIAAIYMTL